jgi:hypothetical protein
MEESQLTEPKIAHHTERMDTAAHSENGQSKQEDQTGEFEIFKISIDGMCGVY